MKTQYLGDSKDSFKWDYHDYLVEMLGYPILNILLMMTPDDGSNDGKTPPEMFPAKKEIINFCNNLRKKRSVDLINELPTQTGSRYKANLHKPKVYLTNQNRKSYFSDLFCNDDQVLLLDPDNGFEPEKSCNQKHVCYSDIRFILEQVSEGSVISVFQHFRRIPFNKDFRQIRQRVFGYYSSALYWHLLMFVTISKSKSAIERVLDINKTYSHKTPVRII